MEEEKKPEKIPQLSSSFIDWKENLKINSKKVSEIPEIYLIENVLTDKQLKKKKKKFNIKQKIIFFFFF